MIMITVMIITCSCSHLPGFFPNKWVTLQQNKDLSRNSVSYDIKKNDENKHTNLGKIYVGFQTFGIVFGLSDAILGLTFLAWGNCIGGKFCLL